MISEPKSAVSDTFGFMVSRALASLVGFTLFASGCATADDGVVAGKVDTGKVLSDGASEDTSSSSVDSSTMDTGTVSTDSGTPDTTVADTATTDSVTVDSTPDMEAAVDSATTDTAADAGPFTVLVYDDYPDVPSHAPAAVAALGGTTIMCDDVTGTTTWDAGGFDLVIIEASNVSLTTGLDTRLVTWMTGGHRLILSHWKLDTTTALTTELGVTVSSYSTAKPIYKDASTFDFFAGITSPISGPGVDFGVHGFTLSVTSPSFLAGRADSATGAGAIAVTHGGKVVVNGFLSPDFADIDADTDGTKDIQELLTNELAYVLTK